MKNLWSLEDIIKKVKRQCKVVLQKYDKGLMSKMYKENDTITEKSTTPILKITKDFKTLL